MATIPPIVHSIIVCDDILRQPGSASIRLDFQGFTHTIRAKPGESFPITHDQLCVFLVLPGGVGVGRVEVVIVDADTDEPVFRSETHDFEHPADRHSVSGLSFRLQRCVFRRPGVYWVEFRHNGTTICQATLFVR